MSLSSSSTVADAIAQYNDNLSWEGDATKAQAALEAIRFLLINREIVKRDTNMTFSYSDLLQEKQRLEAYVAVSSDADRATFTEGIPLE